MQQIRALAGKAKALAFFSFPQLIILLLVFCFTACNNGSREQKAQGYISVHGKKMWYRIYGPGDGIPVLMMHGGPGFPSYYLEPLAEKVAGNRKVILFDQLGCGRSERDIDTAFMSITSHMEQVDSLLAALQLKKVYLYAHSYGTMLAMDYYLKAPERIKGIVFASPCMSTQRWVTDADTLIRQLPDSTRDLLLAYTRKQKTDSIKTARAIDVYFSTYYNRKQPLPAEVDSAIKNSGQKMYEYMWGRIDFECTGTLKDYNRIKDLPLVKVPVLFTCGEFDAARPATVRYYQSLLPGAAFALVPGAGHGINGDNLDEVYRTFTSFLAGMETRK